MQRQDTEACKAGFNHALAAYVVSKGGVAASEPEPTAAEDGAAADDSAPEAPDLDDPNLSEEEKETLETNAMLREVLATRVQTEQCTRSADERTVVDAQQELAIEKQKEQEKASGKSAVR